MNIGVEGLERQKSGPQSSLASEPFNEAKVAELLGGFEVFKQTPHAYEGWLADCTLRERKMIESLVSAFWDYNQWAPRSPGTSGPAVGPLNGRPYDTAAREHT